MWHLTGCGRHAGCHHVRLCLDGRSQLFVLQESTWLRPPKVDDLLPIEPKQGPFGRRREGTTEQRWNGVADLLEHLPLTALELETIVERLQASGLANGDPTLETWVNP